MFTIRILMSMVATVIVLWLPKDYTHHTNASSKSVNGVTVIPILHCSVNSATQYQGTEYTVLVL